MTSVLHVVGVMDRAGTETWLMHVLRNTRNSDLKMDFLVHSEKTGDYDEEIRDLGSDLKIFSPTRNPLIYSFRLYKLLAFARKYEAIHSHVHYFSGWILFIARLAGVRIRVAHSHNDTSRDYQTASLAKLLYIRSMKALIRRYATCGLAASQQAAKALYGNSWTADPRWQVLHCGIDFNDFRTHVDRSEIRSKLGIDNGAYVVGHVGRFVDQKNHYFLIEIFEQLKNLKKDSHLLLVGVGPLLDEIKELVKKKGLHDCVSFAGVRKDVPQLMKGAMDIFVFPSKFEGLGLVLVEAQEAMLPCVISDVIPDEVVVSQISKISLANTASEWAVAIDSISRKINNLNNQEKENFANLLHERFSIESSIKSLICVYKKSFKL